MSHADYSDNLPPHVSLADIDREAYGGYGPEEDEFWCIGCMLELPAAPDGVPDDEYCEECRAEIEGGARDDTD